MNGNQNGYQNSEYYQRLVKEYGLREAKRIWRSRGNKNINFKELGDALSKYLHDKK